MSDRRELERVPEPERKYPMDVYLGMAKNPVHVAAIDDYFLDFATARARSPRRILDVGSGTGCIAVRLVKNYPDANVFGVDRSSEAVETANRYAAGHGLSERVTFEEGDATNLSGYQQGDFDLVVCNHLLHELGDDEVVATLREMGRLTSGDGNVLFVMDVVRPRCEEDVGIYLATCGSIYTDAEREIYRDSILAGYRPEEFRDLVTRSGILNSPGGFLYDTFLSTRECSFSPDILIPTHNMFLRTSTRLPGPPE